ncbi:MAG: hypothetical protein LQ337_004225, partial [Flavoplaca oasis]
MFSYISRPELLGTPEMNRNNRKEQEDLSFSRLIIDRQLWNTYKQVASSQASSPPLEDEFGQSLDKWTKQGLLSAELVFEARIYLDIQDIMGDSVGRGYKELVRNSNKIDNIMNLKVVDGAWNVGGTGERWHERDTEVVMRIKQTSMFWILDHPANAFPKFNESCLALVQGLQKKEEEEALKRPLTNLQFLAMLKENIPRITRCLRFDYITLTKQCAKLLKSMRQQIILQLEVTYLLKITDDSVDQTLPFIVVVFPGSAIGPQLRVAKEEIEKFLGTYKPQHLISNFSILARPARTPSGYVHNHWNISLRHVALTPGDLVFFVQPDSQYVHVGGPIQIVEGQTPGHVLNPKSLVTLQTIARLITKAFVEGMDADSSVPTSVPWTWATKEPNFARRIMMVMTDMGVRQDLMNMTIADANEMPVCNEAWKNLQK